MIIVRAQCKLCGSEKGWPETKLCDRCWELKTRIENDPALAIQILKDAEYLPKNDPAEFRKRVYECLETLGDDAYALRQIERHKNFFTATQAFWRALKGM